MVLFTRRVGFDAVTVAVNRGDTERAGLFR
jgi:hypothetical protein